MFNYIVLYHLDRFELLAKNNWYALHSVVFSIHNSSPILSLNYRWIFLRYIISVQDIIVKRYNENYNSEFAVLLDYVSIYGYTTVPHIVVASIFFLKYNIIGIIDHWFCVLAIGQYFHYANTLGFIALTL
ncbi:hypothetical protein ACJX0J_012203, partial [Zea mays]